VTDIGDNHSGEGASITRSKVALVVKFFTDEYGAGVELTDIDHDKATQLLNWRRKHKLDTARALLDPTGATKSKSKKIISAYTVNDTIEQLKKLFTYAKARKAVLPNPPDFGKYGGLWVKESKSRPRMLSAVESDNLDQASATVRGDYDPLIQFSRVTGKRKSECLLRWSSVKWDRGIIVLRGKGDKEIIITITPAIRAILWPLQGHHPDWVFTYVAKSTVEVTRRGGVVEKLVAGKRYPVTKNSLRRVWGTIRKAAGIPITGPDRFRYHDIRHDFASNLLASIPTADGMKVVQQALGHAKITTTMGTYAHVTDDRVADAIEAQAQARLARREARAADAVAHQSVKLVAKKGA
jgi:integrase